MGDVDTPVPSQTNCWGWSVGDTGWSTLIKKSDPEQKIELAPELEGTLSTIWQWLGLHRNLQNPHIP